MDGLLGYGSSSDSEGGDDASASGGGGASPASAAPKAAALPSAAALLAGPARPPREEQKSALPSAASLLHGPPRPPAADDAASWRPPKKQRVAPGAARPKAPRLAGAILVPPQMRRPNVSTEAVGTWSSSATTAKFERSQRKSGSAAARAKPKP